VGSRFCPNFSFGGFSVLHFSFFVETSMSGRQPKPRRDISGYVKGLRTQSKVFKDTLIAKANEMSLSPVVKEMLERVEAMIAKKNFEDYKVEDYISERENFIKQTGNEYKPIISLLTLCHLPTDRAPKSTPSFIETYKRGFVDYDQVEISTYITKAEPDIFKGLKDNVPVIEHLPRVIFDSIFTILNSINVLQLDETLKDNINRKVTRSWGTYWKDFFNLQTLTVLSIFKWVVMYIIHSLSTLFHYQQRLSFSDEQDKKSISNSEYVPIYIAVAFDVWNLTKIDADTTNQILGICLSYGLKQWNKDDIKTYSDRIYESLTLCFEEMNTTDKMQYYLENYGVNVISDRSDNEVVPSYLTLYGPVQKALLDEQYMLLWIVSKMGTRVFSELLTHIFYKIR
jgi:hypothetical protein